MFEWLRARRAAKRLGLRDRGRVDTWYILDTHSNSMQPIELLCERCATRIRIGINKQDRAVQYCWRCCEVFENKKREKNRVYFKMKVSLKMAERMDILMQECRMEHRGQLFDTAFNLFELCVDHTKKNHQIVIFDSNGNHIDNLEFGNFKYHPDEGWRVESDDKEDEANEDSEEDNGPD